MSKFTIRLRTVLMAACAVMGLVSAATTTPAWAQETPRAYAIAGQGLDVALRAFATTSGKKVAFDAALVKGKTTSGVRGQLGDAEALRRLLAGSGLGFERTDAGGFVIRPDTSNPSEAASASVAAATNNVFALNEVVVTGTAGATDKFTAPYSVSTLKEEAILDKAPRDLVDVMRGQPGINAENSGGSGGDENIEIRGLPFVGFRLFDVLEDGLPLYESNYERFLNIDELYRGDLMTQRAEIERGRRAPSRSKAARTACCDFQATSQVQSTTSCWSLSVGRIAATTDYGTRALHPPMTADSSRSGRPTSSTEASCSPTSSIWTTGASSIRISR